MIQSPWFPHLTHPLIMPAYLAGMIKGRVEWWTNIRTLLCVATVVDTVATSNILETAAAAGGAAEIVATRKHTKYSELKMWYTFVHVAIETFGPLNWEGLVLSLEARNQLSSTTSDTGKTSFLFQSLSMMIQHFNAVGPCQGSQKLTSSDSGSKTDPRAMMMMNNSYTW